MKKENAVGLLISIIIAETVGVLSGALAGNSSGIYQTLALPPLSPPGWVFPVVWTILYALMGIVSYLIYQSRSGGELQKQNALLFYGVQLFVNFLWSIVFFRFGLYGLSVAVVLLLLVLVMITVSKFYQINRIAAYLLFPYLLWLLFAVYLNVGTVILN